MKNQIRINKFNELLINCNYNMIKDDYYNIKDQILKFINDNDINQEYNNENDMEQITNTIFNKLNINFKLIEKYNLNDEFNNLIKLLININNEIDKFIDINERSILYKIYNNKIDENIIKDIIKYKENVIYNYVYYIFSNIIYYSNKILCDNYISNNILIYYINYIFINLILHISSGLYIKIVSNILFKYVINGYINDFFINCILSYIEKYKFKSYLCDINLYVIDMLKHIYDTNIMLENQIIKIFKSNDLEEYNNNIKFYNNLLNNVINKNNKTMNFSILDYEIID